MKRAIERADSWEVGRCGNENCTAFHILLSDENDERFAIAAIGVEHLPMLIKRMQDHACRVAALKGDKS